MKYLYLLTLFTVVAAYKAPFVVNSGSEDENDALNSAKEEKQKTKSVEENPVLVEDLPEIIIIPSSLALSPVDENGSENYNPGYQYDYDRPPMLFDILQNQMRRMHDHITFDALQEEPESGSGFGHESRSEPGSEFELDIKSGPGFESKPKSEPRSDVLQDNPQSDSEEPFEIISTSNGTSEIPFIIRLFDTIFAPFFGPSSETGSEPSGEPSYEPSYDTSDEPSGGAIDDSILRQVHEKTLFDMPSIEELPQNYKNTTSEIHQIGEAKVQVNQTIHKNNENGANDIFIFKVFNIIPENVTEDNIEELKKDVTEEASIVLPKNIDNRLNEIEDDNTIVATKNKKEDDYHHILNRKARSVEVGIPKNGIVFPPNHLARYQQSFVNNKQIRSEDIKNLLKDSKSKSFVYKNIGGKTTFYIVNHKAKTIDGSTKPKDSSTNDQDVEIVGPLREPDLSRDTLVNPSGGDHEQQGLIQVDPDAEVFDLGLVIKEIDSRPKNK